MTKKVIMFDFDNTIVDSLSYWYNLIDKVTFKRYGLKPDPRMPSMRKGKSNKEVAEIFIKLTNLKIQSNEILEYWNEYIDNCYTTKVKLINGVREFLYYLKSKGYTLLIASATDEKLLKIALSHFNLQVFDKIFTEPNTNLVKHNSEFFKLILRNLNLEAKDILFFEDSVVSIKSATSLGIDTCAVIHKYNKSHKKELLSICKAVIKDYKNSTLKKLEL